jgi:AbrB family looped-hinge helix DNA binding protein
MRTTTISKGGQVSIPAEVRHRWGTRNIFIDDQGGAVVIRPIPDDPIGAAMGSLKGPGPSSDEMREMLRAEESDAEERKWGRP